ncbi:MAG: hypothetical protein HY904_12470 [Deltaproteobacteria bacterium]|nr:hypothetical protein [Deltaproteobacteria bacterium]
MQCPGCRASLPVNLDRQRCPRCGRPLGPRQPETSSPSREFVLAAPSWGPGSVWDAWVHVLELTFSPRVGWERAAGDTGVFAGRRSPPAVVSLLLSTLGALLVGVVMATVGRRYGVGDYGTARAWSAPRVALVTAAWPALGWLAMTLGRAWARAVLPADADRARTGRNASLVAVLGAAPALASTALAAAWLLPDVGPFLVLGGLLYAGHACFLGMWRGSGLLLDLDAAARRRVAWRLAAPLALLYVLAGAGGLALLLALEA